MAAEMSQIYRILRGFRPMGVREYPDKIEGYLGCDHDTAGVA
jgi:hypothetical protein